jgi:hypothetical protein
VFEGGFVINKDGFVNVINKDKCKVLFLYQNLKLILIIILLIGISDQQLRIVRVVGDVADEEDPCLRPEPL